MAARRSTIQSGLGPTLHAADNACRVAGAACLVSDGNTYLSINGNSFLGKLQLASHFSQGAGIGNLVHGTHFACHAHHGKAVGAVRGNLKVEHRVGHLQVIGNGHARGSIVGEHPNALMVVAHAQLALGAAHAAACHAAQLRLLDFKVAGKHRADGGNGNLDARSDVRERRTRSARALPRPHLPWLRAYGRCRGGRRRSSTWPTTTPSNASPMRSMASTPVPVRSKRSQNALMSCGTST